MTPVENQSGFTIIEVVLFLALSGLVFIIGFAGIGGRNAEVQFNQAMRSLYSNIENEKNQLINGVNDNAVGVDNTPDSVLLGKYFAFCQASVTHARCDGSQGSRMLVYDVIGDNLSNALIARMESGTGDCGVAHSPLADLDMRLFDCANPRIAGPPKSISIDYGTTFSEAGFNVTNDSSDGFGFFRSLRSSRILLITHARGGSYPTGNNLFSELENGSRMFTTTLNGYGSGAAATLEGSATFCFRSANNKYANFYVGYDERQTTVTMNFDPKWSPNNVVASMITGICGDIV